MSTTPTSAKPIPNSARRKSSGDDNAKGTLTVGSEPSRRPSIFPSMMTLDLNKIQQQSTSQNKNTVSPRTAARNAAFSPRRMSILQTIATNTRSAPNSANTSPTARPTPTTASWTQAGSYDEMEFSTEISDGLAEDMSEEDRKQNNSKSGMASSRFLYDEKRYQLDQYDSLLAQIVQATDDDKAFFVEEKQPFEIEHKQNPFKPTFQDNTDVPLNLLESSLDDLPFHVQQTISLVTKNATIVDFNNAKFKKTSTTSPLDKSKERHFLNKDIIYERDLENHKQYKQSKQAKQNDDPKESSHNLMSKLKRMATEGKNQENETGKQQAEIEQLISTKEQIAKDMLAAEAKEVDPSQILQIFEDVAPPVDNIKQSFNISHDAPNYDILLGNHNYNDDVNLDANTLLLFEPRKLMLEIFDGSTPVDAKLFCEVTLYDGKVKISETVRFSVLPEQQEELAALKFLFKTTSTDNVFIMFRINRQFCGEFTETKDEMYSKPEKAKDKERKALIMKSTPLTSHFAKVPNSNMGLCFAMGTVRLAAALKSFPSTINAFYHPKGSLSDAAFIDMYVEDANSENPSKTALKALKPVPGYFDFLIKEITPVGPFYGRVHSENDKRVVVKTAQETFIARDVTCFQSSKYQRVPKIVNDCFVYPESVQISKKDVKNIQVAVFLKTDDNNLDDISQLKCFYDSSKEGEMKYEAESGISFKDKTPFFNSEMRCKLPSRASKKHHFLFKFYNVYHKDAYIAKHGLKTVIGYAFLPLVDVKSLVEGLYELPIYASLPQSKYTTMAKDADRFDGGKPVFSVYIRPHSCCYTGDVYLQDFLNFASLRYDAYKKSFSTENPQIYVGLQHSQELISLLSNLSKVSDKHLNLAPLVLDNLFAMLYQSKDLSVQKAVFRSLMYLAFKYFTEDKRVIMHYVKYQFASYQCLEAFAQHLDLYLTQTESDKQDETIVTIAIKNAWFVFAILLKSMVLHRSKYSELPATLHDYVEHVLCMLREIIEKNIVLKLGLVSKLNQQISAFLRVCLYLDNRRTIMNMAARYVDTLRYSVYLLYKNDSVQFKQVEEHIVDMQLIFFTELFTFDYPMSLYLPYSVKKIMETCNADDKSGMNKIELMNVFNFRHFIYTPFAELITRCLYSPERKIRLKAITFLRELLLQQTANKSVEEKQRIMIVHFEFFLKFLDILNNWHFNCDSKYKYMSSTVTKLQRKLQLTEGDLATSKEEFKKYKKSAAKDASVQSFEVKFSNDIKVKEMTLTGLKNMLSKHENDMKAEAEAVRDEKRQLFCCVLHILANMNENVLRVWWKNEHGDSTRRIHFLMALQMSMQSFEYVGSSVLSSLFKERKHSGSFNMGGFMIPLPQITKNESNPSNNATMRDNKGAADRKKSIMTPLLVPRRNSGSNMKMLGFDPLSSPPMKVTSPVPVDDSPPDTKNLSPTQSSAKLGTREQKHRDYIQTEKYISHSVSFFVLDIIMKFIQDNKEILSHKQTGESQTSYRFYLDPLMVNVIMTILNFLTLNQSEKIHAIVLAYLRHFFGHYHGLLFAKQGTKNNEYGELFCEEIMNLCNYKISYIRKMSAGLLYLLIKYSFEDNGFSIARPRVMATLALSKLLQQCNIAQRGESSAKTTDMKYLKRSFELISKFCIHDKCLPGKITQQEKVTSSRDKSPFASPPLSPKAKQQPQQPASVNVTPIATPVATPNPTPLHSPSTTATNTPVQTPTPAPETVVPKLALTQNDNSANMPPPSKQTARITSASIRIPKPTSKPEEERAKTAPTPSHDRSRSQVITSNPSFMKAFSFFKDIESKIKDKDAAVPQAVPVTHTGKEALTPRKSPRYTPAPTFPPHPTETVPQPEKVVAPVVASTPVEVVQPVVEEQQPVVAPPIVPPLQLDMSAIKEPKEIKAEVVAAPFSKPDFDASKLFSKLEKASSFIEDVGKLCSRLQNIVTDTITVMNTISKEGSDTYKTEELYYRISLGYVHIPELRLVWLFQLANYHKELGQHVEAAQCIFRVLYIVFDHLKRHKSPIVKKLPLSNNFYALSPYLLSKFKQAEPAQAANSKYQVPLTARTPRSQAMALTPIAHDEDGDSKDEDGGLPQSQEFTEAGIIKLLEDCISYLEQGEYYEHAISMYKILTAIYEKIQNYKKLAFCHENLKQLYENIDQSTKQKSRYFATYFMIVLHGTALPEELGGKKFVYKMPKLYKLFQLVKKIKEMYPNAEVDKVPEVLEPNKVYAKITNVKPYVDQDTSRKTIFQRNINVQQYYYENSFVREEDKELNVPAIAKTYKRKTILSIEQHFPTVKTRMPVLETKEVILTPIEAAIEIVMQRNQALIDCLEADQPDVQTVHMQLQGSVAAKVNGGPADIVQTFLGEKSNYTEQHVKLLNERCTQFLRLCHRALKMSAELIQPHQKALHLEIEKGYSQTAELFSKYLIPLDNEFEGIEHEQSDDSPSVNEEEQQMMAKLKQFRLSIPRHHFRERLPFSFDAGDDG